MVLGPDLIVLELHLRAIELGLAVFGPDLSILALGLSILEPGVVALGPDFVALGAVFEIVLGTDCVASETVDVMVFEPD